ncbi:unnamed protein product [Nippostrongylus brasiliensis]|uniref:Transmembrane protein n=1 Tax=Nippostrongylus brasiliensis TaxID=27835 RepID=A0A0N4XDQ2_NIPBR|nr:unnamed protein product [Nippostrongylus brasiliensis]
MRSLLVLLLVQYIPTMVLSMVIWPDLVQDEARLNRPKPTTWSEKNLGQWCRNFTVNEHTQCPQASVFHQYNCCGEHETECCFAIQGWVIILGSFSTFVLVNAYPPKVIYLEGKR